MDERNLVDNLVFMAPRRTPSAAIVPPGTPVFEHTNRQGVTYYLHQRVDRRGSTRFAFAREVGEGALYSIPAGYEVRETPNGTVSLAKSKPRVILELEEQLVRSALPKKPMTRTRLICAQVVTFEVEVRDATIYVAEGTGMSFDFAGRPATRRARFERVLKIDLVDHDARRFVGRRMTYRGDGGWSYPLKHGTLLEVVQHLIPHLGKQSFFELY